MYVRTPTDCCVYCSVCAQKIPAYDHEDCMYAYMYCVYVFIIAYIPPMLRVNVCRPMPSYRENVESAIEVRNNE